MAEAYKGRRQASGGAGRTAADPGGPVAGTPAKSRELRAQGRKTMRKLLDAGLRVFATRGYHAARVDDIVRAARTSHGTFYLYFANKEDLLRALALECAGELEALAAAIPPPSTEADAEAVLREFLTGFFAVYRRYGPVIRAWMEDHVTDREVNQVGVDAYTRVASRLSGRMRAAGVPADNATTSALMALIERSAYFFLQQPGGAPGAEAIDAVTAVVHRGFFGARVA